MNPVVIRLPGPVELFLWNMLDWLHPLVHLVGLGVAIWAFMRCRKRGYVVIAAYFGLMLFSLFAIPAINRAIDAHREPGISEHTQKKLNAAIQQAVERVLEEEGREAVPYHRTVHHRTVHFPLDGIVLVAGLWLIARREPEFLKFGGASV
jgi:hypothetical protein